LVVVFEGVGDLVALGEFLGVVIRGGGDGEEFGVGDAFEGFGVDGGDELGADEADADGFHVNLLRM
jgi:hypothetical protein